MTNETKEMITIISLLSKTDIKSSELLSLIDANFCEVLSLCCENNIELELLSRIMIKYRNSIKNEGYYWEEFYIYLNDWINENM